MKSNMVKEYKKPMVSVDAGLAEGIYAASGAENKVTFSQFTATSWGNSGQLDFTADFSKLANLSHLTLVITFTYDLTGGWSDGASNSKTGKSMTLTWYSAPTSAIIHAQFATDPSNVSISSHYYYNS